MMANLERQDPFALDDLSDFVKGAPKRATATPEAIREVSEANNFLSRAPAKTRSSKPPVLQRRRRTGRNTQFNIKTTAVTIERFTALADRHNLVFGELLERALDAFESSRKAG